MAIDTRNCFWFGTEDRMEFFATPLQGADSSPSAWGADGTLLNGGGWALNSWGSHKRYTYEWPASSSRETAQKMKSYRDGTYGRGLLYFLEPTIFTTNVLPAHWADPSMSLDNEAPSLVYGVDPTPVVTSGGANLGLPITSAQYDLSGVTPQSIPTPDSSVFIPIPTGHTLFLGAFYSSTGTGGVFATPVNGNGTLGTAVKLTEKPNSDTDVVTDQFSGDLRGVRLWVGRSDATASTVTLAAMVGRLLETSDAVTYGPWVEERRNFFQDALFTALPAGGTWTPALDPPGGVVLTHPGAAANNALVPPSAYFTPNPGGLASAGYLVENLSANLMTFRIGAWNGTVYTNGPSISVPPGGTTLIQAQGLLVPLGSPYFQPRLYWTAGGVAGDQIRVSEPLIEGAATLGDFFSGSSLPNTDTSRFRWSGVENLSSSVYETRTSSGNPAKQTKLVAGPWIGGQGHSGCRFLGTPSYVTNSPIEGGRIGFAAAFVEVGSWVYG